MMIHACIIIIRFGRATYPGGLRYEGEWHRGQRSGFGELWSPSAGEYAGEWRDDKMHGELILYTVGILK